MAPRAMWEGLSARAKFWTAFLTFFSATLALGTAVPAAWRSAGMPALAWESYVDQKIAPLAKTLDDLGKRVSDGSEETAEVRRAMIDKEMFELKVKLRDTTDQIARDMIEQRMTVLEADKTYVLRRLEVLQRERFGPR